MQNEPGDKTPPKLTRAQMFWSVTVLVVVLFIPFVLFGVYNYNSTIRDAERRAPYQYQVKADCSGLAVINMENGPQTVRFQSPGMSRMASLNKVRWLSVSAIPDVEGCKVTSYIVQSGKILAEKSTTSSASAAKVSFQAP